MTNNGWFQIIFFLLVVLAITKPLGLFMTRVFNREKTFLDPLLRPIEKLVYRLTGVDETKEMRWTEYAGAMLMFSGVTMAALYLIERVQNHLPLNPQKLAAVDPALAFNTAASFTTNTNWQAYVPETTMSYLTQMAGLAYHNFISAAVGIALAIAVVRGIARREQNTLGNFWVDMTRATFWVLLPGCVLGRVVTRVAGRAAEPQAVHHGSTRRSADRADHRLRRKNHHANRQGADHRSGPRRFAGNDQGTGHKRRRLL